MVKYVKYYFVFLFLSGKAKLSEVHILVVGYKSYKWHEGVKSRETLNACLQVFVSLFHKITPSLV